MTPPARTGAAAAPDAPSGPAPVTSGGSGSGGDSGGEEVERPGPTVRRGIWKVRLPEPEAPGGAPGGPPGAEVRRRVDTLATEEPLEIRLQVPAPGGAETAPVPISITMRTPGHDFELAAGFLFSEGIVRRREAIQGLEYCVGPAQAQQYNTVSVRLRPGSAPDIQTLSRHFYTTSSCGVCGKASLDALRPQVPWPSPTPAAGPRLAPAVLATLPDRLREAQGLFDRTGGLHACGLFDPGGRLLSVREDVGRHNAMDKLVGEQLLAGQLPLATGIVVLSGRASFELVQKAAMAGAPVLVAVGAPSSLAASAAEELGITLAGFTRGTSFNVYTHPQRVLGPTLPPA
ncbi:MAG TPA: formate dehydrogenase accessory sulfurtransferase FdhD [Chloroflexota bacterium]|nr:formate dehydrogenase accessory sulfurtransferase FdhD [Chloroflexota bacterium]